MWDLNTQQPIKEYKFPQAFFTETELSFSPNGEMLVFSSAGQSNFLKVFNASNLAEVKSIPLAKKEVPVAVAFTGDSSRLVAILGEAVEGFQFKMWKTADWQEAPVNIKAEKFRDYLLRPNGSQIYAMLGGVIECHDVMSGAKLPNMDKYPSAASPSVASSAISPSGRLIAYTTGGAANGTDIMLLDLDKNTSTKLAYEDISVIGVFFSPDGKYVAYSRSVGDGHFKIVDLATKQVHSVSSKSFGATIAFSPGGAFVAIPTRDSVILFALDAVVGGKK